MLHFFKLSRPALLLLAGVPRNIALLTSVLSSLLIASSPPTVAADCSQAVSVSVHKQNPDTLATPRQASSDAKWAQGRIFDQVLIVVLENQDYTTVKDHPYFAELANRGTSFSRFTAPFHPSYPNYLAMVGGKFFDTVKDEQRNIPAGQKTIADLLEAQKLTWGAYAEGYPGGTKECRTDEQAANGLYFRKHVPFLSFASITNSAQRCANVRSVTASTFDRATLPNYAFYTPDMCNDGHNLCVKTNKKLSAKEQSKMKLNQTAAWLRTLMSPLLADASFMKKTLVVVTFDESESYKNNHIYTAFLGGMVKEHNTNDGCYDHYNVLRTIEENFGLGTLDGEDKKSDPIRGIWK